MPPKPIARVACLACRAAKTRCDAQDPCGRCSQKGLSCSYRPSRRGGVRKGPEYAARTAWRPPRTPVSGQSTTQPSPSVYEERNMRADFSDYHHLDSIIDLLSPFSGIRNLDVDASRSAWNQLPNTENNAYDSTEYAQSHTLSLRAYGSDEDILNAYYIYIHPFLPVLPPPVSALRDDQPVSICTHDHSTTAVERSCLPHWPKTSLILAISAILALIPLTQPPKPFIDQPFIDPDVSVRRSYAQLYAEAAFSSLDEEIDRVSGQHSHVEDAEITSKLSPVLALVLLSLYEYCQRGNVSRMRSRANLAVTAAMDLGLHRLGTLSIEAQRRAWWSTMFVSYLSSIDQQTAPIIDLNDDRITTPFPSFHIPLEPWPLLLKAEQVILFVSTTLKDCSNLSANATTPSDLPDQILRLHSHLVALMKELDYFSPLDPRGGPDSQAAQKMWLIARLLIHSARVRLHRFRAFIDIPLFVDKHCDLTAIESKTQASPASPLICPRAFDLAFPFTEEQSSLICLKSSLTIARAFESLPSHAPNSLYPDFNLPSSDLSSPISILFPFFVCGAMHSSYVLLMLHHRIRAALASDQVSDHYYLLNRPEPGSEIQDAERLLRELRQAIESIIGSMRRAIMFEGVGGMSREIEIAYRSAFILGSA